MGYGGRPPKEKSFANMLRIAISEAIVDTDGVSKPKLRAVAEMLVTKAMDGDISAIREVADRLDGKVAQAVEVSGSLETPTRLTDEELELIATASSSGAFETPPSKSQLN